MIRPISFKRHRFPPAVIVQAVRWYFRFTVSIRDVEERCCQSNANLSPKSGPRAGEAVVRRRAFSTQPRRQSVGL